MTTLAADDKYVVVKNWMEAMPKDLREKDPKRLDDLIDSLAQNLNCEKWILYRYYSAIADGNP